MWFVFVVLRALLLLVVCGVCVDSGTVQRGRFSAVYMF
jgi:hypothetical protein